MTLMAVILLRGMVKTDKDICDTLHMLRLNRKNHCVLVTESQKGMIQKVRNWITWGEVTDETLKNMIGKRGRYAANKKVNSDDVDKIFDQVKNKKSKEWEIKPVFRLTPPSKGFRKSIRKSYPKGELGYRGDKINDLLKKMI
jgi:large subunit ribosomal protein L30